MVVVVCCQKGGDRVAATRLGWWMLWDAGCYKGINEGGSWPGLVVADAAVLRLSKSSCCAGMVVDIMVED